MDKKIIAMIPARIGSTRLPKKNLALLDGKPLISYAIEAAKKSGVFNSIVINSEHPIFGKIAKRYDVEFYKRPIKLGASRAKSDSVVYDFMVNQGGDILVWVNPTSPLQQGEEIRDVVEYFIDKNFDSLITVKNENVHCLLNGKPVNFNPDELFARTQDLKPVQPFVYSLMMWKFRSFMKKFEEFGHALLCGKLGFYTVGKMASVVVKTEDDLKYAEFILTGMKLRKNYKLQYDPLVEEI